MRRRIALSHPLVVAAVAGAALGVLGAVLLLRFGDPPGAGFARSNQIFLMASLPTRRWMSMVFGWTWWENRAAEFLTMLTLNGAVWAVALTALGRGLLRSARLRRAAVGSLLTGTALAMLVWTVRVPLQGPYDGVQGLIFLAQIPGMMLLTLVGYDPYLYDGTEVGGLYQPGAVTLTLFALANTMLAAWFVAAARFTWQWIRMPMPRRGPVAEG
jgi:hypothetical protein